MAAKKAYPLRLREDILEAVARWADDDLRSVNGQIEYILREALWRSGRLKRTEPEPVQETETEN
ncbi:MAG TPA: Arc family DNA-binding protein [Paracoccaceae bacterium]|nr:Arc family DNA-binding protein [Paracoccaceae bacterium]